MPKVAIRNPNGPRSGGTKYDAHHKVLSQTYGAFADLRRELSDSKETVCGREDILKSFATCPDSQRSWLLLEDYFEKLLLSRKDFPDTNWWPRLLNATGKTRLEELAFLFLRAKRSVPPELQPHASLERFARAEEAEQEVKLVQELENWLSPPTMPLLDAPRATLRVVCRARPDDLEPSRHRLAVQFLLSRPRTGEKARTLRELVDLVVRATHEQELFPAHDWEFIQWIADTHRNRQDGADTLILSDAELLQWLARWGNTNHLEFADNGRPLQFLGQIISLAPHLENGDKELSFTHRFNLPGGENHSVADAKFFNHQPPGRLKRCVNDNSLSPFSRCGASEMICPRNCSGRPLSANSRWFVLPQRASHCSSSASDRIKVSAPSCRLRCVSAIHWMNSQSCAGKSSCSCVARTTRSTSSRSVRAFSPVRGRDKRNWTARRWRDGSRSSGRARQTTRNVARGASSSGIVGGESQFSSSWTSFTSCSASSALAKRSRLACGCSSGGTERFARRNKNT